MAINKKLIHFNEKDNFTTQVESGQILDTSIVFIKDAKEIYTHGTLYKSVNWDIINLYKDVIPDGISIMYLNNLLKTVYYTYDNFSIALNKNEVTTENVIGIAVNVNSRKFVIHPNAIEATYGETGTLVPNISTLTSNPTTDYSASLNTSVLRSYNSPAAEAVYNTYFKDGRCGVFPSAGYLQLMFTNTSAINNCIRIIGGDVISGGMWSSTQYSEDYAWKYTTGGFEKRLKTEAGEVRPIIIL